MKRAYCLFGLILSSCIVVDAPRRPLPPAPPPVESATPVVEETVYVEPPVEAPPPIAVRWAPPPMRVELPPPAPYPGAFWVGGYWHWDDGQWVWFQGRWMLPPQPQYVWCAPYYENRNGLVIYIAGHWGHAGVAYVPPPRDVYIPVHEARPGYVGYAPHGPSGVFVPPPPGSRAGVIIPAPLGTPPAVVMSAPPVVRPGMTIQPNSVLGPTNTTNGTNVPNVSIVAPPGVTQSGHPVRTTIPAASLPAVAGVPPPAPNQFQRPTTDGPHGFGQAGPSIPAPGPTNSPFQPPQYPLHPDQGDRFVRPTPPPPVPVQAPSNPSFRPEPAERFERADHPGRPERPNQEERFAQPRPPNAQPPSFGRPAITPPVPPSAANPAPPSLDGRRGLPQPVARSGAPVEHERGPKQRPPADEEEARGKGKRDKGEREDRSRN